MPACKKSVKFIRLKLFKWELNFFYLRLLTKYFIMKKVLFIAGFVSSVAIASTPKEVTTEMVAVYCPIIKNQYIMKSFLIRREIMHSIRNILWTVWGCMWC
jgi:hypothetical protein